MHPLGFLAFAQEYQEPTGTFEVLDHQRSGRTAAALASKPGLVAFDRMSDAHA